MDAPVVLTGNPNLPKSERTIYRHFRTEVVRPPEPANFGIGNAPRDPIRGPGIDSSQFAGRHTTSRWDAQRRQVNGRFGEYTSAAEERRTQLGLKFYF